MATEENPPAPPITRTRSRESRNARADGRRQFLIYLDGELIEKIKEAALGDGRFAYEIVEEVLWKNIDGIQKTADEKASARRLQQHSIRRKREG